MNRSPAGLALAALAGAAQGVSIAWPWGVAQADWLGPTSLGAAVLGVFWPQPGQPWPVLQGLAMAGWLMLLLRARSGRQALVLGGVFGSAWLAGVFWWLFISMHTYGGLAAPLAAAAVAALAAFLAGYTAVVSWFFWRSSIESIGLRALLFAALWTLAELARATWLTGFPWGAVGYAHLHTLGWLAPWVGVYGMGAVAAGLAAWVALTGLRHPTRGLTLAALVVALWGLGPWLTASAPDITRPVGDLPVVLLQGNIAQDDKFEPGRGIEQALDGYGAQLAGQGLAQPLPAGALVVAPETAFPLLPQTVDTLRWLALLEPLSHGRHAALLGLPLGTAAQGYANAVWALTPDSARTTLARLKAGEPATEWDRSAQAAQELDEKNGSTADGMVIYRYEKHHLVPFGEFIPPLFRWFVALMNIPLGDFNRGALGQAPLAWAGQRIAPNICYEDLFGEELARGFAHEASAPTVLVNVSNLAWFGNTVALDQHLHISRLRALELGRPMVRATNTGATVVIDHRGRVTAAAPRLQPATLHGVAQGREGLTPYARWASRWGLWPLGLVCVVVVLAALGWRPVRG